MSSTTAAQELTVEDRAFLAKPRLGFLTVAGDAGIPEPRPVWFEATDDGAVQLFSAATSPKVRRGRRGPRASLGAANAVGEPEFWVPISGTAAVEEDGGRELAARLGRRYWDRDAPDKAAALDSTL